MVFGAMQGDAALLVDGLVCVEILMTKCHNVRLRDLLLAAYQAWREKARSRACAALELEQSAMPGHIEEYCSISASRGAADDPQTSPRLDLHSFMSEG